MTNIVILLTAIAAYLTLRSVLDAIRTMRNHQSQARALNKPFADYAIEYEKQTQSHLKSLYYRADIAQKYGRTEL